MKRKEKSTGRILISILLMIPMLFMAGTLPDMRAAAADSITHKLVFASDYRGAAESLDSLLKNIPDDPEYVSLLGDMRGEGKDDKPVYETGPVIFDLQKVFKNMSKENVSILWADHDGGVNDNGSLVKCKDGGNSGPLFEGKKSDGSAAYYVYGIGFKDMADGGERCQTAAKAFKNWADSNDQTAPVIVLCHVPIQAMRGDNKGAAYWNEALNYVATRTEGITDTEKTGTIRRNVVFLSGHNYTCDTKEYYFEAGGKMNVQVDDTAASAQSAGDPKAELPSAEVQPAGEPAVEPQSAGGQPEGAEDAVLQDDTSGTINVNVDDSELNAKTTGVGKASNIYYTALTAGYLKANGTATLMTITDNSIELNKYKDGSKTSIGTNGTTLAAEADSAVIKRVVTTTKTEHSSITVTKTDAGGNALSGAEFALLDGDNKQISTYTGSSFSISTNDAIFASRLPAVGSSLEMTLKETKAPAGYQLPSATHKVVISATEEEKTENGERTVTTKYGITIDGNGSAKIVNTKTGSASGSGTSAGSTTGSTSKAVGNIPKTGDPLHPGVYGAVALLAALALAAPALMRYAKRRRS